MTDTSSLLTTLPTAYQNPVTAPSIASPTVNGALSDSYPPEEDEPYTIKCICAFQDDDGNTVFCEKCETWQHIECYYHGKKVPDVHNCADCEPRPLDGKRATERQRRLREQADGGDRKIKRASSKSHKKKNKEGEHTNGFHPHERHDSTGREQPPTKRPKTSHRPSVSVSSINGTPVLAPDSRKRAHSTAQSYPSPTKSPLNQYEPLMPRYSPEFLHLYDDDPGKANLSIRDNFNTIDVTMKLKAWTYDPSQLAKDTNGKKFSDVFMPLDDLLNPAAYPPVSLQTITNHDIEIDGRNPTWQVLRIEEFISRESLVGEIKGSIGELREYCHDPANRWPELRHPEPFVFFHPNLPIYIDSRREGTKFRYLRRSCRPNVTMKTVIDKEGEYHYCFYAKQDIPAGSELTATWYLDQNVLNGRQVKPEATGDDKNEPPSPETWASRVLANFGDCACDSRQPCMLAPLDRRHKSLEGPSKKQQNGRKKTKTKHMSPPITSRGSTSRAGSETVRGQEEDDHDESRSTSGSVRSKPRSRDMTPNTSAEGAATTGLSDREKRKIAAAEKTFERLEQGQQEKKKKKRTSGSSALNTPNLNTTKQFGSLGYSQPASPLTGNKSSYIDASTSRQYSASPPLQSGPFKGSMPTNHKRSSAPITPIASSSVSRPTYVDSAAQTENDGAELEMPPPTKRRRFTPLTQRLLKRCHDDRLKYEETEQRRLSFSGGNTLPSPVSPSAKSETSGPPLSVQRSDSTSEDADMKDASMPDVSPATSSSPVVAKFPSAPDVAMLPPPPLPSQAAHTAKAVQPPIPPDGYRLQLTNLPPVPAFTSTGSVVTPTSVTPTSQVQSPIALTSASSLQPLQTPTATSPPGAALTAPSPIKKKLSLGDYMSRRNATPVAEKPGAPFPAVAEQADSEAMIDKQDNHSAHDDRSADIFEEPVPSQDSNVDADALGGDDGDIAPGNIDVAMKDVPIDVPAADPAPLKQEPSLEAVVSSSDAVPLAEQQPTEHASPSSGII